MNKSHYISQIPILRNLVKISKRWRPPGFEGIALYDVIEFFIEKIKQVGLNQRASAISFNFIMAIPPACIFLFSLVPLLPIANQFYHEINSFIKNL